MMRVTTCVCLSFPTDPWRAFGNDQGATYCKTCGRFVGKRALEAYEHARAEALQNTLKPNA